MENFVNMPKTKRGMATLNKIVNSAEKLFYKKGYHGTGINDITTASNVALGTFYIYFEDKNADLNKWVQDFKQIYPSDNYQVIGYDPNVRMIQIQIPEGQRDNYP
ncbi:MAG: TetR/AcrR family transcriptional regulator [Alkalibacterium thalassium]|nr:TetR/AcrR family transcriptional regulator [Alkalibacterium thalassium]